MLYSHSDDTRSLEDITDSTFATTYSVSNNEFKEEPNNNEPINTKKEGNEQKSRNDLNYVVDPVHTSVMLTVDGEVVPTKRCLLKMRGFTICDDVFPHLLNPKLYPVILFLIVALAVAIVVAARVPNLPDRAYEPKVMLTDLNNATIDAPISDVTQVNFRADNITKVIEGISGPTVFIESSPQYRALKWIIEVDGMVLSYSSHSLVQRYSLMVLFYSLSGETWETRHGYGSDIHECDWFGISCQRGFNNGLNVIGISLTSNGLGGELPKEIRALDQLKKIKLDSNRIHGSIPTEIGELHRMRVFTLFQNQLSGTIPSEIGKLQNAEKIYLNGNMLVGTIPQEIGNCTNLMSLNLGQNFLGGTIPSSIGNLKFLLRLHLFQNKLSSSVPSEISRLSNLITFGAGSNDLTGSIPPELSSIPYLEGLILNRNRLIGTIPSSFGDLMSLKILDMAQNSLTGPVPSSLGKLTSLNIVKFNGNMLTGFVPQDMCKIPIEIFIADCGNKTAKVVCPCCTQCF